jgi:16S rRNA (guanine527-N7)-methyltransferase
MTIRKTLVEGAEVFGIAIAEKETDAFLVYIVELEKWSRKINLTAIHDEQEIVIKHFIDSFSYIKGFDPFPGARLLDMGSGAGFPALPIKILYPDLQVTLVESVQKKASFLRHMVRTLALTGVDVLDKRIEALSADRWSAHDVVTARAFAKMEEALQLGVRFLKPHGIMVLSRGPEESIKERDVSSVGMAVENRLELSLPVSGDRRAIWVFRKKA